MHKIAENKFDENIFKAYDIRGVYPEEINEDAAYRIARAFIKYLKLSAKEERPLKIIAGSDTRPSSPALKKAFIKGLADENTAVTDAGVVTTPLYYFAVNQEEADGGAMITASHLPSDSNGIKLTKKGAMPLGEGSGMEEIKGDAMRGIFTAGIGDRMKIRAYDFLNDYKEFLKVHFPRLVKEISALAGGKKFPGIAFDADEDRVVFEDEKGNAVPGDIITALLAKKYARPGDRVVYDVRSSRVVKETIEATGAAPIESRVGHAFIKPLMKKEDAVFGGEVTGHYYFRDFFYCDSGIFAALAVLNIILKENKGLGELVRPLLKYAKTKELNYEIKDKEKMMDLVVSHFPDGKVSYLDGAKVEYGNWWFNLRPSNTEDFLRLNIEADTPELLEEKKKLIEELLLSIKSPIARL